MRRLALRVNVNTADAAALETLPGVGPVLASRIIAARPLATLRALDAVKGVGPATLRRIAPRVQIVAHPTRAGATASRPFDLGPSKTLRVIDPTAPDIDLRERIVGR